MILSQPTGEDIINLFGMEYKMITIVAVVRNIDISSTKYTYELEDLTGKISSHLWVEEDTHKIPNIMLNSYVRIIGAVRSQNNVKSIMLFKIHAVSGINEVNTHYLEVVNARYMAEEYSRGGGGNAVKEGVTNMEIDGPSATGETLQGKELAILKVIRASADESGKSREDIQNNFSKIPANEIRTIIDKLVYEGHIYTTVDQDHFSACF